ncbi:biliverdin-producing heme oxygenase [Sphingomonas psychrotolerans]|uniref:Biliverdin-producing heme oxygenase n=1 Tax=Sphingomonas psychrotolerans TaxID=1327635 RepID=A0ABU3N4L7_9SPHN|nr:biliverdin-producing heme oxygenase [Sphingomonas psychrotolerans]MDT8759475.1 biliverdin-producing heme oxygenase [Sphingomonas psychrotolerans]
MNSVHRALRTGTAEAHDRVDAAFAAFDLTDRESYAAFLRAHAEVLLPLEDMLPGERILGDWEARKRGALLKEDLAFLPKPVRPEPVEGHLSASAAHGGEAPFDKLRANDDLAALAGALYVLEGSRLGGRFLSRQLPREFPRAYLDADQAPEKWRNLLDRLETIIYQPAALQSALAAAHQVFAAFERSARVWAKD